MSSTLRSCPQLTPKVETTYAAGQTLNSYCSQHVPRAKELEPWRASVQEIPMKGPVAFVAGASGLVAACATSVEIFAGMPESVFFLDPNRLGRGRRPGLHEVVRHIAGALGVTLFESITTLDEVRDRFRDRHIVADLDIFKDRSLGLPCLLANEASVAYSATGLGYLQGFLPKIMSRPQFLGLRIAQMRWIAARRLRSNGIDRFFVAAPIGRLYTLLGASVEVQGIDAGILRATYRQAGEGVATRQGLLATSPEVILLLPFVQGRDGHETVKRAIKFARAQVSSGQQIWVKSHPRAKYDLRLQGFGDSVINLDDAMGQAWPIEALLVHHPLTRLVTEASSAALIHAPDRTTLLSTESNRRSMDSRITNSIIKDLGYVKEARL